MNIFSKRPTIGLALGSGGARGLAHIGVIKTLEKHNIAIDYIAGTSAGSIVGSFYAKTKNIGQIEKYIVSKGWWQMISMLVDPSLHQGILGGNKTQVFIEEFLGKEFQYKDFKIPFRAIAVNLKTGMTTAFSEGLVLPTIYASCAIPMIYKPAFIHNELYIDGSATSPVPVDTVKKMGADIIIAVNLQKQYSEPDLTDSTSFLRVAELSFMLMSHNLSLSEVKKADIVVNPRIEHIHWWKSLLKEDEKRTGIQLGELAMDEQIPSLQIIIKSKQPLITSLARKIRSAFR